MKKLLVGASILLSVLLLSLSSCLNKDKDEDSLIDPSNSNALAKAMIIENSTRSNGTPPSPSSSGAAFITPLTSSTTSSNGSSTPVIFSFQNGNAPVGAYVQVVGANSYFDVEISNPTNATAGQVTLPVGLPTNLDEGFFELSYCLYDNTGLVSNVGNLFVDVKRLGTGALQVSLSWNTATDQDLHIIDPSGAEIYYANSYSSTGGELDYDNTSGFGPENVFWATDAPDGSYSVYVDDYSGSGAQSTCFITITAPGVSRTFQVTTQGGGNSSSINFTKSGSNYSF
ncbi:MAG TPA: hypothetical protein PLS08_14020 [Chryseolinea sp.]|nr:hypothetical protein [Chryseolinea sp.]